MNFKNKIIIGIVTALIALASWLMGLTHHSTGSVSGTEAYVATTTDSTSASATYSYPLCLGSGTLGSVVVVQPASAGKLTVWDATTTATSTIQTTSLAASTLTYGVPLLVVANASDVVGTLTFDSVFYKGIVLETQIGFNGQYVVTCKK